jgi:hypothetical protein
LVGIFGILGDFCIPLSLDHTKTIGLIMHGGMNTIGWFFLDYKGLNFDACETGS